MSRRLPHFNGAKLDDIVDYLTYAFAPMVLLWANGRGMIPGREPLGPHWTWHPAPLATVSRHL